MPAPHVIEYRTKPTEEFPQGQVSGRVGPHFLVPLQVAFAMYEAGFRYGNLPIGLAVFKAESLLSPDAEGDLLRVDEEWGPSLNVSQIRTRKDEFGKGTDRDASRLKGMPGMDIALRVARKWVEAEGWGRWGAYSSGAYKENLEMATRVCSYMGVRIK